MFGNVWVIWNKHSLLIVFEIFGSPEKDWLLQQELYSAILPGNCSLIIEVVLEVILGLLASLAGFLPGPPPAAPPISQQSPGTSSSSSPGS